MRSNVLLGLGLCSALAFAGVGCRDDIRVQSRTYNEGPTAGTLVDTPTDPGLSSPYEGTTGSTLETPVAPPTAIGGGPLPSAGNPPTGANDEGNPVMTEEPLPAKPDASEQSAGTTQPPAIAP
jgi:hypothetical protein